MIALRKLWMLLAGSSMLLLAYYFRSYQIQQPLARYQRNKTTLTIEVKSRPQLTIKHVFRRRNKLTDSIKRAAKQMKAEEELNVAFKMGLPIGNRTYDCTKDVHYTSLMDRNQTFSFHTQKCGPITKLDLAATDFTNLTFRSTLYNISKILPRPSVKPITVYTHEEKKDKFISESMTQNGFWEPAVAKILMAALESYPEAGLLDLGANLGVMSLIGSMTSRHVVSIEPLPDNLLRLGKTLVENGYGNFSTVIVNPVRNDHSEYRFVVRHDKRNIGGTKVKRLAGNESCEFSSCVKSITLNDLVEVVSFDDVILKIDVERSEKCIFEAVDDFFAAKRVRVIVIEWRMEKADRVFVATKLFSLGYEPRNLEPFSPDLTQLRIVEDVVLFFESNMAWIKV